MGEKRGMKALEAWCRNIASSYRDVQLDNMTTSWRDGLAFCAIIHHFRPDLIDFDSLSKENIFHNNNLAFTVAEQRLGIPALLDAEDMVTYKVPDKLSIMTYLSQLYKYFNGMEHSPIKTPSKRHHDEKDSITALAEPPGKLASPQPPSNNVVPSPRIQRTDKCQSCKNRVYILERLIVDNKLYHRTCFKCHKCSAVLRPGSYVEADDASDVYECIQCPRDEEKCDMSRSATTAALRRFSDGRVNNPSSPLSPLANDVSSVSQPATPCSNMLPIASRVAQARSQFCARANDTESDSTPFTDTGQEEETPSIIKVNRRLFESSDVVGSKSDGVDALLSPNGADVRNNNVPEKEKNIIIIDKIDDDVFENDTEHSTDTKNAVNDARSNSIDGDIIIRDKSNLSSECSQSERPTSLPVVSNGLDESETDSSHRKSVSEMVKMFGVDSPKVTPVLSQLSEEPVIILVTAESECQEPLSDNEGKEKRDENEEMLTEFKSEGGEELVETKLDEDDAVREDYIIPKPAPRLKKIKAEVVDLNNESAASDVPIASQRIKTLNRSLEEDKTSEMQLQIEPPPKPPRSTDDVKQHIPSEDYPDHLNPFGDDSDDEDRRETSTMATTLKTERKSLNPFGSSDDEDDNQEAVAEPVVKSEDVSLHGRKVIPFKDTNESLNPFSSDSDSESEVSNTPERTRTFEARYSVTPSPRQSIDKPGSNTLTLGRKKRLAPKPPSSNSPNRSESGASSPLVTPKTSPRIRRKPPPPPPSSQTPIRSEELSSKPTRPPTLDVSSISFSSSATDNDNGLTEKSLKELDNMNLSKVSSSSSGQRSSSDQLLSPDLLDSQSIGSQSTNTFGYWKKKKKQAPPVPIPQRRQIKKIPLKEIQAELVVIETKELELEQQGVAIEVTIREKFCDDIEPSAEEEDLIMQLFELVNKKNALFRRQAELIYLKRQQRLEEEHADLEFQIRCLMEKPDKNKSEEEQQLEEKLIARLIDVVHQRNEIIESMEMDRLREAEEDQSIQEQMAIQKYQPHRGSLSSQSSYGSSQSGASSTKANKSSQSKKKKDKIKGVLGMSKKKKVKDEDKDLDEAEVKSKTKDKKKKWF